MSQASRDRRQVKRAAKKAAQESRKAVVGRGGRSVCLNDCLDPTHPQVGDSVSVVREEHGWHDGRVGAKVLSVSCSKSSRHVSYTVQVDADNRYFAGSIWVCPKRGDVR